MSIPNEKYKSLSAAEFFKNYPELTGFSNPARALYQTIRSCRKLFRRDRRSWNFTYNKNINKQSNGQR